MRVVVVSLLLSLASVVGAEPRVTTESVTLRKKPGEKEAALATIPADTAVTVLGEEGRWLKIRVKGVVGYVTRTTITGTSVEPEPTTDGWSSKRKGDELFIDVPAAGTLVAEPKPNAAKISDIAKGAHLIVIDATTPNWIHARDEDGHEGWITRSLVENGATNVQISGNGVDLQGKAEVYSRPALKPLAIRIQLGIGYRAIGMDMSSNVDGGLANFLIDADAAAAVLDADGRYQLGDYFVGGDVRVTATRSSPGITFNDPSLPSGQIPFQTFAADLGVRGGVRLRDAIDVAVRVGGHYDAFIVTTNDPMNPNNAQNVAMLPSERLVGATVGARVELAPPSTRFGAALRFDALAIGSRAQTPGYRDGTASTAHAFWGGLVVRYQLVDHISPFVSYDFGHLTTTWTGQSEREPSVTNADRTDTTQLVQLGVTAEL